jgi:hypothetical protein
MAAFQATHVFQHFHQGLRGHPLGVPRRGRAAASDVDVFGHAA